jgi:folate-binding protein YgfZ
MRAVFGMSSPFLSLPGAVPAEGVDAGVAAHYGHPYREQKALLAGTAVVDLSHRDVLRISGADRLGWLHSLTTQHFEALAPYEWTTALVLSPNGHVEHAMAGYDDGEAFWAHAEPGDGERLLDWLDSMRFLMRVQVEDVSADWVVLATGPETVEFVPRADFAGHMEAALAGDCTPAGVWAFEALRIARGEARLGLDTDHRTIPNEVGWLGSAVHMDKGCYRGQETVARVFNLGRPPRRLVLLHLDGSVDRLPARGGMVAVDGREVGFVGSSARHFELGPIALALVKRSTSVDADLLADGVAASQEAIVDPDVGLHVRARL